MRPEQIALVIPIIALLIPIVLVPSIVVTKMRMRARELEHRERMRALELGREFPSSASWLTAPMLALALGVLMPWGVFLAAALTPPRGAPPASIFIIAAVVAIMGVLSGAFIAHRHYARQTYWAATGLKDKAQAVDADEYDFAGHRVDI